jgi:hypothetical protein
MRTLLSVDNAGHQKVPSELRSWVENLCWPKTPPESILLEFRFAAIYDALLTMA